MKNIVIAVLVGLLLGAIAARGQAITYGELFFTGSSTNCVLPLAGSSAICGAGDKILASTNGGAWVQIGVISGGTVKSVMGIAPDASGNVPLPPYPTKAVIGAATAPLQP